MEGRTKKEEPGPLLARSGLLKYKSLYGVGWRMTFASPSDRLGVRGFRFCVCPKMQVG
jgi:hypothetical protein